MEGLLATFGQPGVSLERVSRCFKLLKVVETTVGLQVFSDHFGLRFFQVSNFVPNFLLWTFSSVGKFRKFRKASKKCDFLSTKAIWRTFKQLSETFTSKKNIKTKIYISTDSPSLSSQKKNHPLKLFFTKKNTSFWGLFLEKVSSVGSAHPSPKFQKPRGKGLSTNGSLSLFPFMGTNLMRCGYQSTTTQDLRGFTSKFLERIFNALETAFFEHTKFLGKTQHKHTKTQNTTIKLL